MNDMIEPIFRHWFGFDVSQAKMNSGDDWYVVHSGIDLTDFQRQEVKRAIESHLAGEATWITDRRIQIPLRGVVTAHQSLNLTNELERIFNYSAGQPEDGKTLDGEVWTRGRQAESAESPALRIFTARYSLAGISRG